MIKECIICGSKFEPKPHLQKRQKCCCKECSKKHSRQLNIEWSIANKERKNQWRRKWREKNNPCLCRICGKVMTRTFFNEKSTMHEQCILNEALSVLRRFEKLTRQQKKKLYNHGFTLTEVYEMI